MKESTRILSSHVYERSDQRTELSSQRDGRRKPGPLRGQTCNISLCRRLLLGHVHAQWEGKGASDQNRPGYQCQGTGLLKR